MKLDELAALNDARTPGEWRADERVLDDVVIWSDGDAYIGAIGDTNDTQARDDARAIVAAVNAMGPMIRALRAARAYLDATDALVEMARPVTDEDVPAYHTAQDRQAEAAEALDAALREVE